VPGGSQATAHVSFVPAREAAGDADLSAETRFPLGLFRAWTVWRPAARILVLPAAESNAPLPPRGPADGRWDRSHRHVESGEIEGVRAYRRGDPMKLVAWKKAAQALETGSELVSRDTSVSARHEIWLEWSACGVDGLRGPPVAARRLDARRPSAPAPTSACACPASRSRPRAARRSAAAASRPSRSGRHERAGRSQALVPSAPPEGRLVLPLAALLPALAGLAAPAARGARHPVPARGHRLDVLPHLPHLPGWTIGLTALVLLWRGQLAVESGPLPSKWVLVSVLTVAIGLTYWSYGSLLGKEPGVTLAVTLMALKTLELRARRDAFVVFFLGFFIILTHFLYSQSLVVAVAMLISIWGLLTALVLAHMPVGQPSLRQAGGPFGAHGLLGAPVMALLFVLFPRIGPLWGVPQDGISTTGLSNTMRIGSVTEVARDESVAMRIRFDGTGRSLRRCISAARC
jgi:hypothetical protein